MVREVDIAVVGAGPTGLYAAYYAGFRGLSTAVIDALPEVGGQVTAMYPEKLIFDVAGFPSVKGQTLVDDLVAQTGQFNPTYLLEQRADFLARVERGIRILEHHLYQWAQPLQRPRRGRHYVHAGDAQFARGGFLDHRHGPC